MDFIFTALRGVWLLLILHGLMYIAHKQLKINVYFVPLLTICTIASALFLAGLCGQLWLATGAIALVGTACTVRAIWCDYRKEGIHPHLPLSGMLVCIGFLIFAALLGNTELIHYDNYTHWATVVKEMLLTNAFPTAQSVMVEFTNYPVGTACWIYFVCTIVSHAQGAMLVAQAMLLFACFGAIFAIIQERRRVLLHLVLALGLSTLSFFNVTIRINNLLVDFVLPMITLAVIAVIYTYRKNLHKAMLVSMPMLGFLVVVKSTGAIFAGIALAYLCVTAVQYRNDNLAEICMHTTKPRAIARYLASVLGCVGLSVLPLFLWNLHVDRAFAGVVNKFETDVSLISSGIGGKSNLEVQYIIQEFLATFTDFSLRPTLGLWAFEICAIIACIIGCVCVRKKWQLPKVLFWSNVVLVLYYSGILAMYLFSMPLDEALYLAGYERYASSIVVLFGGVLTMCLTCDLERSFHYRLGEVEDYKSFRSVETKNRYNKACVLCVMGLFMILTSEYYGTAFSNDQFEDSLPAKMQSVVGDRWDTVDDSRYLIYAPDYDGQVTSYYLHYVASYYLWASQVEEICMFYEDNLLNLLSQYDYLVIVETDADARRLMDKYFCLAGDAGIYKTQELLANAIA